MSTVIIIGGGGHAAIHRITAASAHKGMTAEQLADYKELVEQLEALASRVESN